MLKNAASLSTPAPSASPGDTRARRQASKAERSSAASRVAGDPCQGIRPVPAEVPHEGRHGRSVLALFRAPGRQATTVSTRSGSSLNRRRTCLTERASIGPGASSLSRVRLRWARQPGSSIRARAGSCRLSNSEVSVDANRSYCHLSGEFRVSVGATIQQERRSGRQGQKRWSEDDRGSWPMRRLVPQERRQGSGCWSADALWLPVGRRSTWPLDGRWMTVSS